MSESGNMSLRGVLVAVALAFMAGLVLGHVGPSSLEQAADSDARPRLPPTAAPQPSIAARPAQAAATPDDVRRFQVPVTPSQPSKGPADAVVTIVQWCDLYGDECRRAQALLAQVTARYSEQARLVFRHFAQASREAQLGHEFARIAHTQAAKFWDAQALLLAAEGPPTLADVERYAAQLGLDWPATRTALEQHDHAGYVAADRVFAQMFAVAQVPAVFVNGRRLSGDLSLAPLEALIEDEIARAGKLLARGIPKDQVYAELTRHGAWERVVRKN
jgi:protein-disulfide isomerase